MNSDQFDAALKAYCRRQSFRPFVIEFTSGAQVLVKHPEVVRRRELFYVFRAPDGGFSVFTAECVTRFLDTPMTSATK